MRHAIDPKSDCVFKAVLGSEENRNLLIHFLNAFLEEDLLEPLVWVEISNPYNEKEFLSDKLSIVDIKAKDSHNRLYQIEIQLTATGHLPARILYNWADIYSQQLKSGQEYRELKPTYAIWLLAEDLLDQDAEYLHHYKMRDQHNRPFSEHGGIWLLELNKFRAGHIETEQQRWLKFFKEGESLNDNALPDWMNTQEMQQAMSTLSAFSEKEQQYFQYQARQEYLREQKAIQYELEQRAKLLEQRAKLLEQKSQQLEQKSQQLEQTTQQLQNERQLKELEKQRAEAEFQRADAEKQRADSALAEIQRLKALLDAQS